MQTANKIRERQRGPRACPVENRQEILGGGFNEGDVAEPVKRFGFHRPHAAGLRGLLAVGLHLRHDRRPSSLGQERVLRGQARFQNELIIGGVGGGLAFQFQPAQGRVAALGFE